MTISTTSQGSSSSAFTSFKETISSYISTFSFSVVHEAFSHLRSTIHLNQSHEKSEMVDFTPKVVIPTNVPKLVQTIADKKKSFSLSKKCLGVLAVLGLVFLGVRSRLEGRTFDLSTFPENLNHSSAGRRLLSLPSLYIGSLTLTEEVSFYQEWIASEVFGTTSGGPLTITANQINGLPLPQGLSLSSLQTRLVSSLAIQNIWALNYVNNYIIQSTNNQNLQIINVKDPTNPSIVGIIPTAGIVLDIACLTNVCYIFCIQPNGLQVVDISNLPFTTTVKFDPSISIGAGSGSLAVSDSDNVGIVILNNYPGVQLLFLNLTDPLNPQIMSALDLPSNALTYGSDFSQHVGCVTDFINGKVYIVDFHNISNPFVSGSASLRSASDAKRINNGCVVNDFATVHVLDISNTSNPLFVSQIPNLPSFNVMQPYYNYIYLGGFDQLVEVDLSDFNHPVIVSNVPLPITPTAPASIPHQMTISDKNVFSVDNSALRIATRGETFTIQGSPFGGTKGNYTLLLTATNVNGTNINRDTTVDLTIQPAIVITGAVTFPLGVVGVSLVDISISPTLFDKLGGGTLTYTANLNGGGTLPLWLNFNRLSATFTGTPPDGSVGTLEIVVTASDNFGASQSLIVPFQIVYGPTLNTPIQNKIAQIGVPFSFQLPNNTIIDKDNVGFQLSVTNNGSPLPAWLSYLNGTFSGTPQTSDLGTVQISLKALADNGVSMTTNFQIQIVVPGAPIIQYPIPNLIAPVNDDFIYELTPGTFLSPYGEDFTYTVSGNPPWLYFDGTKFFGNPSNGLFNRHDDVGFPSATVSQVSLTATGNKSKLSSTINYTIVVNGSSRYSYLIAAGGSLGAFITFLKIISLIRVFRWNKRCKALYRIEDKYAKIGGTFRHEINGEIDKTTGKRKFVILSQDVGPVTGLFKRDRVKFWGLLPKCCHKTRDWTQGGLIRPEWLKYNKKNVIFIDHVPDPNDQEIIEDLGDEEVSKTPGCLTSFTACRSKTTQCWVRFKTCGCCDRPVNKDDSHVDFSLLKVRVIDTRGYIVQEFKLHMVEDIENPTSPKSPEKSIRRSQRKILHRDDDLKNDVTDDEGVQLAETSTFMDSVRHSVDNSTLKITVERPSVSFVPPDQHIQEERLDRDPVNVI